MRLMSLVKAENSLQMRVTSLFRGLRTVAQHRATGVNIGLTVIEVPS
jgi:hypothetical protein